MELSISVYFGLPESNKLAKHSLVILKVFPVISAVLFKRVKKCSEKMRSWLNFKAATTQRVNAALKVVIKSVFIKMTHTKS